ncbi:hypothetical protein [uncultured Limosilactobacillus sp.]|uniref:hypothetical protein n=1 Tax=uncultured Limosilactobacillus sp. TaxID=2837629 RepID=UPI0025EC0EA2|nr:hypothetical protein [uncultured Limosilactobacillus sp.]
MPKLALKRSGSAMLMVIIVLVMICGTMTYYNHYYQRQAIINQRLMDRLMAESMARLSDSQGSKFNCGRTKQISQSEWLVTLKSGEKIKVII